MAFDISSAKPVENKPSGGFDISSARPVTTTGGGAALVTPKQRAVPVTPEKKEEVRSLSEQFGEYLFEPPTREDFDFGQIAGGAGVAAGLGAAAPKAVKTVGKVIGAIPLPATKRIGKATQTFGEVLGETPLWKRLAVGGTAGGVGTATEQTAEMMGVPRIAGIPAGIVAGGTAAKGFDYIEKATGLRAGSLSKQLREEGAARVKEVLQKAGLSKDQAEAELSAAQKIERQLSEREMTAEQRAQQRQAILPEQQVRQDVANRARQASSAAQRNAEQVGLNANQARDLAAEAGQGVVAAENSVAALEQQLIAQPQISKEKFGRILQDSVEKLKTDYSKLRKDNSGLSKAINAPGTVNTQGIVDYAQGLRGESRVKVLQSMLDDIQTLAKTEKENALSVKSADSLKGQIDSWINSKQYGDTKLDKEVINNLRRIKGKLIESMPKEYVDALGRWKTLSRPLDIVERNGALAKVVDKDPLSTEYAMAEAAVVGNIINKARAGNPVFTRLLKENKDLQEPARLYFTKELFGQETAPTVASLNTFLKNNESPLRQLGLYDEFKNIRNAQKSAQQAVNQAKQYEAEAKGIAAEAKKSATAAKQEADRLKSRGDLAETRLAETLKTAEPLENILRRSAARAKPAQVATEQRIGAAQKSVEAQQNIENKFNSLYNDLTKAKPKDVPGMVSSLADDLLKRGHINQQERDLMVNTAAKNADQFTDTKRARNILGYLAVGVGVPALGLKFYGPGPFGQ